MRSILLASFVVCMGHAAMAQSDSSPSGGVPVGSNTVVVPAVPKAPPGAPPGFNVTRTWQRIMNIGTSASGPVAWCTRFGTPGVGTPGSWPLAPAGNANGWPWIEEFGNGLEPPPPQISTQCTGSGGTVNITAEER